jgi:hypothetical protein
MKDYLSNRSVQITLLDDWSAHPLSGGYFLYSSGTGAQREWTLGLYWYAKNPDEFPDEEQQDTEFVGASADEVRAKALAAILNGEVW